MPSSGVLVIVTHTLASVVWSGLKPVDCRDQRQRKNRLATDREGSI